MDHVNDLSAFNVEESNKYLAKNPPKLLFYLLSFRKSSISSLFPQTPTCLSSR